MITNKEDNKSAMIVVFHPKTVKEIFLDCTASLDYEIHVFVDGKELKDLDPNVYSTDMKRRSIGMVRSIALQVPRS